MPHAHVQGAAGDQRPALPEERAHSSAEPGESSREMAPPRENGNGKRRKTASSSAAAAPSASKRAVITEMQSAHSMVIDEAGPVEIVRATRACEAEIFSGFRGYPSMMDKSVHRKLEEAAALVAGADLVVFSGLVH